MTLEADGGEGGKEEAWPVDRGGRGGKELMKGKKKKKPDTCTHARHLLSSAPYTALRALCKTTGGRRDCADVCVSVSKLLFSESRKLSENWANCTE